MHFHNWEQGLQYIAEMEQPSRDCMPLTVRDEMSKNTVYRAEIVSSTA